MTSPADHRPGPLGDPNGDPLTALLPGSSAPAGENIASKTSVVPSNATNVASEEEIEQLEREIDDKATEIIGQFQDRIEYELLPLLYRMRGLLPHGEWGDWYERFRKRVRLKWALRTVQRKFKELEDGWNIDPDEEQSDEEQEGLGDTPAPLVVDASPKELLTTRLNQIKKVLSEGTAPVDADPLRSGERRISDALELVEETRLAIDEGLLDGDEPTEPTALERHAITPGLTRREIPAPPVEQDKHGHAALYHRAQAAAIAAANAIEQEQVEARFYPVLIFLTNRKSVTFGRFLQSQGIKKGGPYGEKWRGRTCFNLPGGEPYRTYEEAWAYIEAFAKALPDLDICYGVDMLCMDESQYGGIQARKTRITECNSPEPSHGG